MSVSMLSMEGKAVGDITNTDAERYNFLSISHFYKALIILHSESLALDTAVVF